MSYLRQRQQPAVTYFHRHSLGRATVLRMMHGRYAVCRLNAQHYIVREI